MNKILPILFLLSALSANAAERITAVISFTNTPANANTITVNGVARTWKTVVATPATEIAVTNSAANSATNYFGQITQYLYSGPLTVSYANATNIQLVANSGNPLAVSVSGSYAVVTLSTQQVANLIGVRVPVSGEPTSAARTYIGTELVNAIDTYSTNAISAGATALSNHLSLTTTQVVSGGKLFSGANTYSNATHIFTGGTVTNVALKNATEISGTIGSITNGGMTGTYLTNVQPVGIWPAQDYFTIQANGEDSFNFRRWAVDKDVNTITRLGDFDARTFTWDGGAIDVIGVRLKTNATFFGFVSSATNRFTGQVEFAKGVNAALANGNNAAIDIYTNSYVVLQGPTAAFTLNGIAGGTDGRVVILESDLGFDITVANASGVDPLTGNRIRTRTAADVTVTGAGVISLRFHYNSTLARWIYDGSN